MMHPSCVHLFCMQGFEVSARTIDLGCGKVSQELNRIAGSMFKGRKVTCTDPL